MPATWKLQHVALGLLLAHHTLNGNHRNFEQEELNELENIRTSARRARSSLLTD